MWRPKTEAGCFFSVAFYLSFSDRVSHWICHSSVWIDWLAIQLWRLLSLHAHDLYSWGYRSVLTPLAFSMASEGLNSDLLACAEGSFLTEPFPHPTKWHLIQIFILLWKNVKSRLSQCLFFFVMVLLLFACFVRSEVWSKTVPKLGDIILWLCPAEPQRHSFFFLPLIKSRKYLRTCCPEPLNTARANNKVKSNSILLFSSSCQRQKDNKLSRFWGQTHDNCFLALWRICLIISTHIHGPVTCSEALGWVLSWTDLSTN